MTSSNLSGFLTSPICIFTFISRNLPSFGHLLATHPPLLMTSFVHGPQGRRDRMHTNSYYVFQNNVLSNGCLIEDFTASPGIQRNEPNGTRCRKILKFSLCDHMFAFLLFNLHPATFFVHQTIVILNLSCPNRISQSDQQLIFRIYCTKFVGQRRFLT